ncbi:hypothetical protein EIN_236320 [Entamoeba invadens IP1]|uniref:Uncharacterized protein n=1 Tax=Entamoeba invadens IP1 TaxID=370355 RepID=L7FKA3_ENTIV|nr:hypothetical protein EIN_236320 [Entamoeba invadens IP1]ELP86035.1 hypothetical protein EIN_236320 [Entamoeba invadens IP1]|eukprot:XP_004185381.1 hypothetical protein EIN_236320 [Entamoeba invadens IP1]
MSTKVYDETNDNDFYCFDKNVLRLILKSLDVVCQLNDFGFEYFQIVTRIHTSTWFSVYTNSVQLVGTGIPDERPAQFGDYFYMNLVIQFDSLSAFYLESAKQFAYGFEILNNLVETSVYKMSKSSAMFIAKDHFDKYFNEYIKLADGRIMHNMLVVINHIFGLPMKNEEAFYLVFEKIIMSKSCESLRECDNEQIGIFCRKELEKVNMMCTDIIFCLQNDYNGRDVHAVRLVENKTREEKVKIFSNVCRVIRYIVETQKGGMDEKHELEVFDLFRNVTQVYMHLIESKQLVAQSNVSKGSSVDKELTLTYLALYNIEPYQGGINVCEPFQTRFYIDEKQERKGVILFICQLFNIIIEYWGKDYDVTYACLKNLEGFYNNEYNGDIFYEMNILDKSFQWAKEVQYWTKKEAFRARKISYNTISIVICNRWVERGVTLFWKYFDTTSRLVLVDLSCLMRDGNVDSKLFLQHFLSVNKEKYLSAPQSSIYQDEWKFVLQLVESVTSSSVFLKKFYVKRFNSLYDEGKAEEAKRKKEKRQRKEHKEWLENDTMEQLHLQKEVKLKEKENNEYIEYPVLTYVPDLLLQFCCLLSEFVDQIYDEEDWETLSTQYNKKRLNRLIKVYTIATNILMTENFNFTVDRLYGDMTVKTMVFKLMELYDTVKDALDVSPLFLKSVSMFMECISKLTASYEMTNHMLELIADFAQVLLKTSDHELILCGVNVVFNFIENMNTYRNSTDFELQIYENMLDDDFTEVLLVCYYC